jgi:hypothetical protein
MWKINYFWKPKICQKQTPLLDYQFQQNDVQENGPLGKPLSTATSISSYFYIA